MQRLISIEAPCLRSHAILTETLKMTGFTFRGEKRDWVGDWRGEDARKGTSMEPSVGDTSAWSSMGMRVLILADPGIKRASSSGKAAAEDCGAPAALESAPGHEADDSNPCVLSTASDDATGGGASTAGTLDCVLRNRKFMAHGAQCRDTANHPPRATASLSTSQRLPRPDAHASTIALFSLY